jgi:hypothetical protein
MAGQSTMTRSQRLFPQSFQQNKYFRILLISSCCYPPSQVKVFDKKTPGGPDLARFFSIDLLKIKALSFQNRPKPGQFRPKSRYLLDFARETRKIHPATRYRVPKRFIEGSSPELTWNSSHPASIFLQRPLDSIA